MIAWAFVIFAFGLIVFLFFIFDVFGTFAPWIWSIILFIIALGMLNRIWTKEKEAEKEKLASMVAELEDKLAKRES
jgi:hypothetical protein